MIKNLGCKLKPCKMKTLVSITILIFSTQIYANCSGAPIKFWPKEKTINRNSIIMIEGDMNPYILNELNNNYPIYLNSSNHKVKLLVQEILIGEYYTAQVILRPEEELIIGQTYHLYSDSLSDNDILLKKRNPTTLKMEPVSWMVDWEAIDTIRPAFTSTPTEIKKILDCYSSSCGEEIRVVFNADVEDQSEILVKTTVRDKKKNKTATFYLVRKRDRVAVGHGICYGAFNIKRGGEYEVEFSLIDASGNVSIETTSKIAFSVPLDVKE